MLALFQCQNCDDISGSGAGLLQFFNLSQGKVHQTPRVGRVAAEPESDVTTHDTILRWGGRSKEGRHTHGVNLSKLESHQLHEASLQQPAADGDPDRLLVRLLALDVHRKGYLRLCDWTDHGHNHVFHNGRAGELVRQRCDFLGADFLRLALRGNGREVLLQQWLDLLQLNVAGQTHRIFLGVAEREVEVCASHLRIHCPELSHGEGRKVVTPAVVVKADVIGECVHRITNLSSNRLSGHPHHCR
mmetsp:Transcript_4761/g.8649  ORF Transcript_4761/g.8649 Transcript_4761/m.8649 type:complete len:245 (-) Transcript_4761:2113-2847(-)